MSEIIFPWPPKDLSPNARVHWGRRSKSAKAYRKACWAAALEAKAAVDWEGEIHVWITFIPPDKRHRDVDNCIASAKALLDGLADALKANDKRFRLHPLLSDVSLTGGKVRVRLSKGPEA